ncbi:MAG: hypothetical protein ACRDGN_12250 [bacterium]
MIRRSPRVRKGHRFTSGAAGMTFAEVVVAAALLALVVGALLPLLTAGQQTWEHAHRRIAMVQNARAALDQIVRAMRGAVAFEAIGPTLLRFPVFYGQENVSSRLGGFYPAWWSGSWAYRRVIGVSTGTASAPIGYSLPLTFDHAALVAAGKSLSSGNDVRVLYWNGVSWVELDRVLDPQSTWNQAATKIWFKTQAALSANSTDNRYYVYYGNSGAGAPPATEANVFHFADFFNRANSCCPGMGWTITESTGDIDIASNALFFNDPANLNNRPVADHTFPVITERLVWRFGFNWDRTGSETTYRLHMQLGNSANMANPPSETNFWSNAGVGPSLLWAGPDQGMANHEGFGTVIGTTATQRQIVAGVAHIEVIVNVAGRTYDLYISDVLSASGVAFSSAQTSLDRLRLLTWQLSTAPFSGRSFDYTYVRRHVSPEPVAALVDVLTVEYQLNGATSELEYRMLPDAFQQLAGPFRSMSVQCFDNTGGSIGCGSAASVRSVQVSLVAMDPEGIVPDITVTARAFRQVP